MTSDSKVFLVRHGEAAASWAQSADPGLSVLGQQQADQTAERLRAELAGVPVRLVSSPLLRAQETAAPLAGLLGGVVEIDPRFREIPSSVPLSERQDWLREFMRGNWAGQPDALLQWRQELLEGIRSLPGNSVVFTHFLVINSIVGHCQESHKTLVCWPDNASVTTLWNDGQTLRVDELGAQMATVVN